MLRPELPPKQPEDNGAPYIWVGSPDVGEGAGWMSASRHPEPQRLRDVPAWKVLWGIALTGFFGLIVWGVFAWSGRG